MSLSEQVSERWQNGQSPASPTILQLVVGRGNRCQAPGGSNLRCRYAGQTFPVHVGSQQRDLVVVERRAADRRRRVGAGQRVDAAPVRHRRRWARSNSATSTPRRKPVEQTGRAAARRRAALRRSTSVAVRDAERRRVVGMDQHGRPLLLGERGRRLGEGRVEEVAGRAGGRGGTDARRRPPRSRPNGRESPAWRLRHGAGRQAAARPAQSARKRKRPSGQPKPSRKCACSNGCWQSIQRSPSSSASVPRPGGPQRRVDDLARASSRRRDGRRRGAPRSAGDHLVVASGTRPAARSASGRAGCAAGRRPGRRRRARRTWWPAARCRPCGPCRS